MSPVELPCEYMFVDVLKQDYDKKVVKCVNRDTEQTLVLKIPKFFNKQRIKEVSTLRKLKDLELFKHNIVKFVDCSQTTFGKAIVFEALDITLDDYIKQTSFAPMLLADIRSVIQQMATALDALKGVGMIHGDVTPKHIMMVNSQTQPFEVKLIDFRLATSTSEATADLDLQPSFCRSPEIILGGPVSEAIDMWALGCVLFKMICGKLPFVDSQYEMMLSIVELLGQPADHVLDAARWSKYYFNKTKSNSWKVKTPLEKFGRGHSRVKKAYRFKSLDDMKKMRLEKNNRAEAAEREQCVELLKAMLRIDADERITPRQVLAHPFITEDYLKSQVNDEPVFFTRTTKIVPSGVIMVRPALVENTLVLEDLESADSFQSGPSETASVKDIGTKTMRQKKKKNCFQRVFTRLKKTFSFSVTCRAKVNISVGFF